MSLLKNLFNIGRILMCLYFSLSFKNDKTFFDTSAYLRAAGKPELESVINIITNDIRLLFNDFSWDISILDGFFRI